MDIRSLLETFNTVASVIKTVADTPGLNLLPYASTVSSAISTIQFAYEKGMKIEPYVTALKDTFSDGIPTQDKLDALDAKIAELRTRAHAELPPREADEPE